MPCMREARSLVEGLLRRGRQLEEVLGRRPSATERKKAGRWARRAAREVGIPPILQDLGGVLATAKRKEAEVEEAQRAESFLDSVEQALGQLSIASPSMPLRGNSARLLKRIAGAREGKQPLTRVRTATRLLDALSKQQLVYNDDIPAYLKMIVAEKEADKRAKRELRLMDLSDLPVGFISLKFSNRDALLDRLDEYPAVRAAMEGALHAGSGDAPDGREQALGSCRRALENLGKALTGTSDWRDIVVAVADAHVRDFLKKLYSLLSEKGAHGGKRPSASDMELGLHQTFGMLFWMIENRNEIVARSKRK